MYTASYAPKPTSETHQPFTKSSGLLFANATSGFTTLTGTGVSKASRLGPYTRPSNVPKPVVTSSSGHLPYTRSAGAMFTNTTSGVAEQTSSGLFHPSGTGVSSGFAHPSGTTLSSAFVTPTGKNRCHLSSTSRPAAGRLPFSKSAGLVFTNSTSDAAGPTDGAFAHPSGTGVSSGFARPTEFTGVTRSSPMSKSPSATPIAEYYQCGGINWKGNGTCGEGTVCKSWHPYYSQCVSEA
jgi:cellulase